MSTSEKPLVIRILGVLCCLTLLMSYRPETQADENVPEVETKPSKVIEEPVLRRNRPVFRTASYLQEQPLLVPPAPAEFASQQDQVKQAPSAEPPVTQKVPKPVHPQPTLLDNNWSMTITPGKRSGKKVNPDEYNKIYQKIPYRRSEYLANPSYRHDATMEIMFGELRPTVNHRTSEPERIQNPRPQLYQGNQFISNDYWRYHAPTLRYFNRYLPLFY